MISINQLASCVSNEVLKLTIMPTEQCNFRCTYCYEDFSIGKMTRPVIDGVKALIQKRLPELKMLTLEYFGGEPLSAKEIVYEISGYTKNLIDNDYPQVKLFSGMTTNGYNLKVETFKKLLEVGVNQFQISLDGPKELHDKTRLRIDQSGSFDVIWQNLLNMHKLDYQFNVVLRIHVTPENYTRLPELIEQIKVNFDDDPRFGVFFKAIENLGGPKANTFRTLTGMEKKEIIKNLYQHFSKDKNVSPLDKPEAPYICYAAKPNNLVIRASGNIAKCTVVFNDERNNLGKIHPDGRIEIDANKLNLWTRGLASREEKTLLCPLNGLPSLKNISIVTEEASHA